MSTDTTAQAVAGLCPGCGRARTLTVDRAGRVVCTSGSCPAPTAAHRVLTEVDPFHIVSVDAARFHITHPLIERLDGLLLDGCALDRFMAAQAGPPVAPGRYRATCDDRGWWWFEEHPPATDRTGRAPHAADAATLAADREDWPDE